MDFREWENQSILILGFGREGQSSYKFLRKQFPDKELHIADRNSKLKHEHPLKNVHWHLGEDYMQCVDDFEVVVKSPGVKLDSLSHGLLTSQTDIFLNSFSAQTIGITGTKGKSTTASLIRHMISYHTHDALLIGNIGVPPLDKFEDVDWDTLVVMELSAHQLQHIHKSPYISVLLNLYEEHLDHFPSKEEYFLAKQNMLQHQKESDVAIINFEQTLNGDIDPMKKYPGKVIGFALEESEAVSAWKEEEEICYKKEGQVSRFSVKNAPLQGIHNHLNIMSTIIAAKQLNIKNTDIQKAIDTFIGLPHRLEFIKTTKNEIAFYNDSISTIPQTTIQAINTLENVETLILGGFDRMIDYQPLYDFLENSEVKNLILMGPAGKRIQKEYQGNQLQYLLDDMMQIVMKAHAITSSGKTCLLSPAASSYDQYKNFEERGGRFREMVLSILH